MSNHVPQSISALKSILLSHQRPNFSLKALKLSGAHNAKNATNIITNLLQLASWEEDEVHEEVGHLSTEANNLRGIPLTSDRIIKARNGDETFLGNCADIPIFSGEQVKVGQQILSTNNRSTAEYGVLYIQKVQPENQTTRHFK